ncbi:LamG domain-containing protein, partial [Gimesia sp.]
MNQNQVTQCVHSFLLAAFALFFLQNLSSADQRPSEIEAEKPKASISYRDLILSHKPAAFWDFQQRDHDGFRSLVQKQPVPALIRGSLDDAAAGPRPAEFPLFTANNQAAAFEPGQGFLRVVDPGEKSDLDFAAGDAITLEAWINPKSTKSGQYYYIIGKGRTNRKGVARDNQNYSLRLTGSEISFLFCTQPEKKGEKPTYHRWTSSGGGISTHSWHHVAVTYLFGKKNSLKAYIDGHAVSGKWDAGGDTARAPVVDNDEVWIGSSMGGAASSSFNGQLDEVAVYRSALTADQVASHFQHVLPGPQIDWTMIPANRVQVDILEGIPNQKSWSFRPPRLAASFTQPHFALIEIPNRYSSRGIKVDRPDPFLVRALSHVVIPKGKKRILVRARNASRLYIDEKLVAETGFHNISSSAHGHVYEVDRSLSPDIRPLHRGDQEQVIEFIGDGKPHRVRFEMIVGGFRHRPDFGETGVFIGEPEGDFQLLTPGDETIMLTDADWLPFEREYRYSLIAVNAERRRAASEKED